MPPPRTRIALAPPPPDLTTSGARTATARRRDGSSLREVSAVAHAAPLAAPSSGGHHGGTSCSRATSQSQPDSAAANPAVSARPAGGTARPWKRFQVSTSITPYPLALAAAPPHRHRALRSGPDGAPATGTRAQGGAVVLAGAEAEDRRAALPEAVDADAPVLR